MTLTMSQWQLTQCKIFPLITQQVLGNFLSAKGLVALRCRVAAAARAPLESPVLLLSTSGKRRG